MNFSTPLARLRLIGLIEGISCVLLFFVAMPLKYLADQPRAVLVVGSIHGLLWTLYMLAIANVWLVHRWSMTRTAVAVILSIPPTGTFFFDRDLKREQQERNDQPTRSAESVESGSVS